MDLFVVILLIINLGLTGYLLYKTVFFDHPVVSGEQARSSLEAHLRVHVETETNFLRAVDNALKSGRVLEAELILKSCLVHHPNSSRALEQYVNLLVMKTEKSSVDIEKLVALHEAEKAILRYVEIAGPKAVNRAVEDLERVRKKDEDIREKMDQKQQEEKEERVSEFEDLVKKLRTAEEETEIRDMLATACGIEEELLDEQPERELRERYNKAREEMDKLAARKGEEIRNKNLSEYNSAAVERLSEMLDDFNKNEKVYSKSAGDFAAVIKETIGTINTHYLSAEVLTYFNYVYGFVFSLVEDDVKYEITKVMTDTPKDVLKC